MKWWYGVLLLLISVSFAHATTYHVTTNGGGNTCSSGNPCGNIETGVGKLTNPGDILDIHGGDYFQNLEANNFIGQLAGTESNPIIIRSAPGEQAIINGWVNIADSSHQYIILDGLIIDGTGRFTVPLSIGPAGAHHITFQNGEIRNAQQGLNLPNSDDWRENVSLQGHHNTFQNCSSHHSRYSYAFYIGGGHHNTIDNCDMYSNWTYGFQIYTGGGVNPDNGYHTIKNSRIFGNSLSGFAGGFNIGGSVHNVFYNNVVYDNQFGIDIRGDTEDAELYNNTVYGNVADMAGIWNKGVRSIIKNNIVYNNGQPGIQDDFIEYSIIEDNTISNPSFVSPGTGSGADFRLNANSNSISNGQNLSGIFTNDKDFNQRPSSGGWSRGAYQFGGTPVEVATYYAAPGATGSCTEASPCSVNTALTMPSCGSTIYLRQGTYNQNVSVPNYGCTSWTNAVTIASYGGETATIVGSLSSVSQYTIYNRLVIDGSNVQSSIVFDGTGSNFQRFQNGEVRNASQNLTEPCVLTTTNTWGPNVIISGGSSNHEFLNSRVHHARCSHAFLFNGGQGTLIDNVEMDHNGGYGLQVFSQTYNAAFGHHIVRNSYLHDNGFVRTLGNAGIGGSDDVLLYNNVIAVSPADGMEIRSNQTNTRLYNNVFYDARGGPGILVNGVSGTIIRNNIVYNNVGTITTGGTQSNNLFTDPLFFDPATGDFHIRAASAARGVGMNLSNVFTTDKDNFPRPASGQGNWDVGAYQFNPDTPIPSVPSKLEFGVSPGNGSSGNTLTPSPVVQIQRDDGVLMTTATNVVTLNVVSTQIPQANLVLQSVDTTIAGHAGAAAIDGNTTTYWQSQNTNHPHHLIVSFPSAAINGIRYQARPDALSGAIAGYEIAISSDCVTWGTPVATGTFNVGQVGMPSGVTFTQKTGSCLRLLSTSGAGGDVFSVVAELSIMMQSSVVLNGTKVITATGGVATFSNLNISNACVNCILQATSPGLTPQLSFPFTITGPIIEPPVVVTQPSAILRFVPPK